jgi:hypothetical protein
MRNDETSLDLFFHRRVHPESADTIDRFFGGIENSPAREEEDEDTMVAEDCGAKQVLAGSGSAFPLSDLMDRLISCACD